MYYKAKIISSNDNDFHQVIRRRYERLKDFIKRTRLRAFSLVQSPDEPVTIEYISRTSKTYETIFYSDKVRDSDYNPTKLRIIREKSRREEIK